VTWLTNPYRFGQPVTPIGTTTHWDVVFLGAERDNMCVAEIAFAATIGGANLISGGTLLSTAMNNTPNIINGNINDFSSVATIHGGTSRIGYAFASPVTIGEVRLTARNDTFFRSTPRAIVVRQSFDSGATWIPVTVGLCSAYTAAADVRSFPVVPMALGNVRANARLWRVRVPTVQSGNIISCGELEFALTASGATQTSGGSPISSSDWFASSSSSTRAFDGTKAASNCWLSEAGDVPGFLGYLFPEPKPFLAEMRWTAGAFSGGDLVRNPLSLEIQWSADGIIWNTVNTYSGIAAWPSFSPPTERAYVISP
jgi:hypothetical protein